MPIVTVLTNVKVDAHQELVDALLDIVVAGSGFPKSYFLVI